MNAREIAYKTTYEILEEGKPSHVALKNALAVANFSDRRDRAFTTRLVEGTCERLVTIDFVISLVSKVPLKKLKPQMRTVLRNGIYQILFMDSVPDSAACNESVKILKKLGLTGLSGYANGVLRGVAKQKEEILEKTLKDPEIRYSCPKWLWTLLVKEYGACKAQIIAEDYLQSPGVTVRVNLSKTTTGDLRKRFEERGVVCTEGVHHKYALRLSGIDDVENLPGFAEGLFQVQDESSMFVCDVADIKPDDMVLDICAAPGGKSLHAADLILAAGGNGKVEARDLTEGKIRLIGENVSRIGFKNVSCKVSDATQEDPDCLGKYDVVIADVPCSGLGIIKKKPDIKINMSPEKIQELASLSKEILKNAVRYVKPGGTLMFSTCTISSEENEKNVLFIENELGLKLVTKRQLLPGIDGCDGFFFARFIR